MSADLDVLDAEVVDQFAEARQRADAIKAGFESFVDTLALLQVAWKNEDWKHLNYASWDVYLEDEYGKALVRLGKDQSREAVVVLAKWGMSTRAIAPIVGKSKSSVARDLAAEGVPDGTVTGLDGREQPRKKKDPSTFTCRRCGEKFPYLDQREIDGQPHCEDCCLDLEQGAEYGEAQGVTPTKPAPIEPDEVLVSLMDQVAKLASKTPWTPAATSRIIKLATQIQKSMAERG